jgi:hypothetical protein
MSSRQASWRGQICQTLAPRERRGPPYQEQREHDGADKTDISGSCLQAGSREKFGEGRPEDESVDDRGHAIEHSPGPSSPKTDDLLPVQRCLRDGRYRRFGFQVSRHSCPLSIGSLVPWEAVWQSAAMRAPHPLLPHLVRQFRYLESQLAQ